MITISSKWLQINEPYFINHVSITSEAIMPPVATIADELDDTDVAFEVINQDNLPMSIIGEGLLKPFGTNVIKQKPNGIVYPTRRITTNLEENKLKPFTKSNGHINGVHEKVNLKKFSNSHGNLNHCNSSTKLKLDDKTVKIPDKSFTKTLDAKLRKLQRDEKAKKVEQVKKPLFVTTVKRGQFIEPPPELANLYHVKVEPLIRKDEKLYAYASKPRVLNRSNNNINASNNSIPNILHSNKYGHKARCDAAAKAAAVIASSIAGITPVQEDVKRDINSNITKKVGDAPLPYSNLMYERRIYRGSTYAQHPMPTAGDGESAAARAAEARRRAMARRRAKDKQIRGAQLRLASPPPVSGRRHEEIQTDQYLEELMNDPPMVDMTTQTDLFLDRPVSPFYVPAKTGADVATQIYPGDLFDFDMEVQPILEVLVGKTLEQALIEVLEEEELAALREQQRRFLEMRASETAEAQRLEEREKRLQAEKNRRMAEYEEGLRIQKEMEERIAAAVLTQGYMADLLPQVLEGLEEDGFLVDSIRQNLDDAFLPWLMKEVTHELQEMVSSRDVLSDIIREILENRAEIYKALNQEVDKEESEEEGPTQEDLDLQQHLKLQQAIAHSPIDDVPRVMEEDK